MEKVRGFRRVAVVDENTCSTCLVKDGSILVNVVDLVSDCDYVNDKTGVCRCTVEFVED